MSFANWLSALKRSFRRTNANRRRSSKSRSKFTSQFFELEDRCLPAAFIPLLPSVGTVQAQGLNAVVYTPELDPAFNKANLPEAKLITIMNNGSNVIFPIFDGTNSTPDETAGMVTRAMIVSGGKGYSGEYDVTFSLGSGVNPTPAKATAAGNDAIYSITLDSPGSGYKPGDVVTVTSITPKNGAAPNPTVPAVLSAHASNITPAQNGKVSLYDPKDNLTNTYRGYVGEKINGQFQLGLQPGHQVTIQVPVVFWDGGRIYMVDNGPIPLTSQYDPGYPLQANNQWSYNPKLEKNDLAKLGSGRSFVVAPSSPTDKPIYGANFADPTTGYANPNGVVMWYHELPHPLLSGNDAAHGFGFGVPAVLTEATFRDPKQPFIAPNMRPDQIFYIDNYDVSYVDSLAMPASMEATKVPSTPPTPGSLQYTWLGSDLSTSQMQDAIAKFTTQNVDVNSANPGNPNGLGSYFGGLGWDQFYMPPDNNSTASGTVTQINNSNQEAPVTIITASTEGLVNGAAVTISGVTGQISINNTWIIGNITPTSFALVGLLSSGVASSGGTWKAFKTTGVHLQKLPAGYDTVSQSPNVNVPSQFNGDKYNLVSGGDVAAIGTVGSGTSTATSNVITGVTTEIARQLTAGMLLAKDNNQAGEQLFPYGTIIARIIIGTAGNDDSILIMSNKATASGSPGKNGVGGSWLFFGSRYGASTSQTARIAANDDKITDLDPKVGMYLRPGMLVTGGGIQTATNTYVKSISADFKTITLTQNGTAAGGSGPYVFTGSPSSYALQTLINNWYAWADYYVAQLASGPNAAPTGTFTAKTRNNGGRTDDNSLFLDITDLNFDMSQLRVGDVVTSALSTTLTPNSTGTPTTAGYDPSLNYTIVSFDQDPQDATKRWVELSLPVKPTAETPDTFTFTPPQYIVRSSDAPAAAPKSITSVGTTNGQPFTINTASTAGLVDNMEVTISGVTDQTTNLPSAVNGRWVIQNVTANSFQLQGAANASGETLIGGIWSTTAGTIPYTLDFTPQTTSITGISNANGQPIVITTGSTVGLVKGQQVTISGVSGQTGINGVWAITNITATTFELVNVSGIGAPKGDGVASSGGAWASASALQFAQTLFDVMQTMSLLVDPFTQASRSASLLGYVIGGNTGSFVINQAFKPQTGRDTNLPNERTARQLRDEIKSLLRGVYDFNAVPDQTQWYPNPATATPNATLNGSAIKFGIYNLDPYVWFVHEVLHNSSYGFSFDDDVANAQAASSTLQIAVGGNSYTAPNPQAPNALPNHEAFSPSAQWGTQTSPGFFDTTSQVAIDNAAKGQITISGLSQAAVARLTASNPAKDRLGAYITTDSAGLLPTVTIVNIRAEPALTQAITGIVNPIGGAIKISTANTGTLGIGNLVTISGVSGQTTINGRWIVTSVQPTSFELTAISGNGTASSGGTWTYEPSFVTFLKPTGYTPPTDNAKHQFTFSVFLGTTVPNDIAPSVPSAKPGSVITINGTGFTGVFGVSFNGYGAHIVGSEITSITNDVGSPIKIGAADTTGLAEGDTVTINGVFDETTGASSAINGRSFVISHLVASQPNVPGSFELTGQNSTGDGHALVHGSWIAGTDTAFKTIVPEFIPNANGSTYPGAAGRIAVRNQSGTNYSDSHFSFTILSPTLPYGPIDFETEEPGPQLSSNWIVPVGGFVVRNDRLETTTDLNLALVNLAIPAANVFVEAKVNALALNKQAGLVARYKGVGERDMYLGALSNTSAGLVASIWKNVAGAWTRLAFANVGPGSGGVLRLEVVGDSLKLLFNGQVAVFTNDTSLTAAGLVGVRGSAQATFVDFRAAVMNAAPMSLPQTAIDFQTLEPGPQLSESWIEEMGNFGVQANRLEANVASPLNVAVADLQIPVANVFVEANVNALAVNEQAGLVARYQNVSDDTYLGALSNTAGGLVASIWKSVGGVWTRLASKNVGGGTGGLLRLEVVGDSLKLLVNGQLAVFASDATISAAGLVGVRGSARSTFDNFRADALQPIATLLPYGPIDFQALEAGPQLSESWIEEVGNFGVQSNRLQADPARPLNVAVVDLQTPAANVFVEATVNALAVNEQAGLLARYQNVGANDTYLGALSNTAGGLVASIWKSVGGVWTRLVSKNVGGGTGGVLRFEAVGNSLKLLVNGQLAVFTYDTAISAAGLVGVRGSARSTFDDFRADVFDPIATPLPYGPVDFQSSEPGPQLSEQWIEASGNFSVQADRLQANTDSPLNVAVVSLQTPEANVFVEATVNALAVNENAGLLARYQGERDTYLGALSNTATGLVASIWKNVGGVWTRLVNKNVGGGTGGVLRFEVVGDSLKLLFNGQLAVFTYDTTITAGGLVGVRGSARSTFDDFRADVFDPIQALLPYGPIDFQTQEAGPQLSERWIEAVGNLAVQGNQLKGTDALNVATLNLNAPATDGFVQATVTAGAVGVQAGLLARYGGPGDTDTYLAALSNNGANNFAGIWKNVGGTWTLLTSVNVGSLTTGLLRFELSGDTLKLEFDNNPAFTISTMDASLASGTFGVRGSQNALWDDFAAG